MTEKQRACRNCGEIFTPSLRHPNQKTCGAKCKKWWLGRRVKELPKRRERYRNDEAYRKRMVVRARSRKFTEVYGITLEKYSKMLQAQNECCAICGSAESAASFLGNKKALFVDHDHQTGKLRKLLCHKCNSAIGYLRESPEIAIKMAEYLKEFSDA